MSGILTQVGLKYGYEYIVHIILRFKFLFSSKYPISKSLDGCLLFPNLFLSCCPLVPASTSTAFSLSCCSNILLTFSDHWGLFSTHYQQAILCPLPVCQPLVCNKRMKWQHAIHPPAPPLLVKTANAQAAHESVSQNVKKGGACIKSTRCNQRKLFAACLTWLQQKAIPPYIWEIWLINCLGFLLY